MVLVSQCRLQKGLDHLKLYFPKASPPAKSPQRSTEGYLIRKTSLCRHSDSNTSLKKEKLKWTQNQAVHVRVVYHTFSPTLPTALKCDL